MNIFTANQVNQVYVLKSDSTVVANLDANNQITKANNLGSVGLGKTADGKSIYFKHLGAGGLVRSDLIEIANIIDIKATPASAMARSLMSAKVTLNAEALNNSKPIAGEDFVLRIKFQNPIGMSPENQYWKYGVVHATASMTASEFYLKMASSIAKNMSREAVQLVKVYVTYSSSKTEITAASDVTNTTTFNQTYTGIQIEEVEQDWILGIKQQKPVLFTVEPTWVNNGTDEVVWGDVIYSDKRKTTGGASPANSIIASGQPATAGAVVNSKLMADYEYFYMGERGDQYRMVNWPNYVPTTYLVDANWQYGYDTVAIHYAYVGANHSVQKSEKDITFVVPRASTDNTASAVGALAASILAAIKAALPTAGLVKVSGAITSGNVPEFDGTTGAIKDSGKAASDIPDGTSGENGGNDAT
jgi:hypothetical protein